MFKIKAFENLTIQDDFMFYKVMQNKELCKKMLEVILGDKIGKITNLSQQKGIERGIEKGMQQGMQQGRVEERFFIARTLVDMGFPLDKIAKATGLNENEVKGL